jgi:hypothetical protein
LISKTTNRFRDAYRRLPAHVQRRAREAYRRFKDSPHHPSLHFKHVHTTRPIYAARVALGHRAVGIVDGDVIVWFWIGTHAEYERLLRTL